MLLFSFFVLRKSIKNQNVNQVLKDNAPKLINFVTSFNITDHAEEEEDRFVHIKDEVINKLKQIEMNLNN